MGLPQPQTLWTVDEYLAFEREAFGRHEYLDGQILAMAGEKLPHGQVTVNLVIVVGMQLKGTPCQALTKDTKVRSGPTPLPRSRQRSKMRPSFAGLFSYLDLVIVCGEPAFHDEEQDVILNPTAIAEVLSNSTEAFDRGEKFTRYQTWNPTLREYLLIAQDQPQIEHFSRQKTGWSYQRYAGLKSILVIPSIHVVLKLADVYDRVKLKKA